MRRRNTLILLLFFLCFPKGLAQSSTSQMSPLGGKTKLELVGKLLDAEGKPFQHVTPVIILQGATFPFVVQALADRAGNFKFKKLEPALYTLIAAVPRAGEMRQTVDVSASHADGKGRVTVTLTWEEARATRENVGVTASQLAISDRARANYTRALKRLETNDVEGAIALLQKAIDEAPQFSAAWNYLGVIAYQARRYEDAEKHFREALKQDPRSYSPLVNLGGALIALNRQQESLEVNLRAVLVRPDDALAHSQLGSSYLLLGQLEKAEEHLLRAIALEPGHFSYPQLKLAQLYYQQKNISALVHQLEDFIRLHPDAPQTPELRKALAAGRAELKKNPD